MLHAHPQLVHLCKVLQNEMDGILHVTIISEIQQRKRRDENGGRREGDRDVLLSGTQSITQPNKQVNSNLT